MAFTHERLNEFARHYGFHYDCCDPLALLQDVLTEMERGLRGQPSSLAMIPAFLSPASRLIPERRVLALDAGGTNLRAALIRFDGQGKAQEESLVKAAMPGTYGPIEPEAFFDAIADLCAPLLAQRPEVDEIGFCFSYPMDIITDSDGASDGILTALSKEVEAPQLIGQRIGSGLRDALARRGSAIPRRIALLNDTAATLLAGLVLAPMPGSGAVGFILGTGFNTAYLEKTIPKIGFDSPQAPQIVVCESGNFSPRYLGALDREFDRSTKTPGFYALEKACAGAYLGPLTLTIVKQAVRDGVLRFSRSSELLALETLSSRDLNAFLGAPQSAPFGDLFDAGEEEARSGLLYVASLVTERAALFSAAVVAAMVERMEAGHDPQQPVGIAVEGTTYMLYQGLRPALESRLHCLLSRDSPRFYRIAPVENASLLGAAVAALKP